MTDNEKLDLILSRLEKLDIIESEMQSIKSDTQELKQRMSNVENKVTNIELTLENEISVNIKRVAEGHLDLSRNLHEALKVDSEKEVLAIRLNVFETELRKIKKQLEIA